MATLFNMNATGPEPYYGSQNTNQQIEDVSFDTADLFQKAMFDMINTKYGPPINGISRAWAWVCYASRLY